MTHQKPGSPQASPRRLGRGLGSLLSSLVTVDIPKQDTASTEQGQSVPDLTSRSGAGSMATEAAERSTQNAAGRGQADPTDDSYPEIMLIDVDLITPNPRQPREHFDQQAIEALAESIRSAGLMQPILVRRSDPGSAGGAGAGRPFQLIAGERRWRAAQMAGLPSIPAIVRDVDDQAAAELALVENLQREDLNPIERAEAFRALAEDFGLSHQEISQRVGLDRTTITNSLRLNDLDAATKASVRSGQLGFGQARALLSIADQALQQALGRDAARLGWSVRELERRIRHAQAAANQAGPTTVPRFRHRTTAQLEAVCKQLSAQLGTRIHIQVGRHKGAGRIVIDFYSIEQFENIMRRLNLKVE